MGCPRAAHNAPESTANNTRRWAIYEISVNEIETTEDLQKALGLSIDGEVPFGMFGCSDKFGLMQKTGFFDEGGIDLQSTFRRVT